MTKWLTWILALAIGTTVLADLTAAERREERELEKDIGAHGRYVDMGVVLRVVRLDPHGTYTVPGFEDLRHTLVREEAFGGLVDTKAPTPYFCGPSTSPVVWHCSEDQYPLITHAPPLASRIIAHGSEGGGKTEALVRWHIVSGVFPRLGEGREGGQTAPTTARLERFHEAALAAWPAEWATLNKETGLYTFCDGSRIRALSTHQPSKAEGARVQGYSWSWAGSDELQDHLDKNADIEARGRRSKVGVYYRFATCTAKDSPAWRTFKDATLLARGVGGVPLWSKAELLGPRSPFVAPKFWEDLRGTLSQREYDRRVLAHDVGPERQTYTTWSRAENLRPIPAIGAEDVTAEVLRPWAEPGQSLTCLVGFDPGKLFDVSLVIKAYRIAGARRHVWFVVDEVTTEQSTTERHCQALLTCLRDRWSTNLMTYDGRTTAAAQAFVRADPYSDSTISAAAEKPDRSVYTIFKAHGLYIKPAAYARRTDRVAPGTVPREAGIDMVCGLFLNAAQERRLFVACDDRRQPAAPRLVEAIEMSERDELGKAEQARKDKTDLSHWPAALRYALWVLEKPRMPGDAKAGVA